MVTAGHLSYLSFFFYGAICLPCVASPHSFVSLQSATPLRFDGSSQNTWIGFSQTINAPAFPNLKISTETKTAFHCVKLRENILYIRFSFGLFKFANIYNRLIIHFHIFVENWMYKKITEEIFIIILNIYDMQNIIINCAIDLSNCNKNFCEKKHCPMTMIDRLNLKLVVAVLAIYLSSQITSKILSQ